MYFPKQKIREGRSVEYQTSFFEGYTPIEQARNILIESNKKLGIPVNYTYVEELKSEIMLFRKALSAELREIVPAFYPGVTDFSGNDTQKLLLKYLGCHTESLSADTLNTLYEQEIAKVKVKGLKINERISAELDIIPQDTFVEKIESLDMFMMPLPTSKLSDDLERMLGYSQLGDVLAYIIAIRRAKELESMKTASSPYYYMQSENSVGHKFRFFRPTLEIESTYRIQSSGFNICGMNKLFTHVVQSPTDDAVFLSVDAVAIEPSIALSIIFGDTHPLSTLCAALGCNYTGVAMYCFIMHAKHVNGADIEFKEKYTQEEIDAMRSKINPDIRNMFKAVTLRGLYLADQRTLTKINKIAGSYVYQYIVQSKEALAYKDSVQLLVDSNEKVVHSFTGLQRALDYSVTSYRDKLTRFINNPFQMTASSLFATAICRAKKYIDDNKLDILIMFNNADEIMYFGSKNQILEHAEKLASFSAYKINGWFPIHAKYKISQMYIK